ncbi:MAG: PspC domain-containing protein [Alistipes sp.]|nr:PspC domain-containing protein [Alistipes sp.]MBQ9963308.1 PspC domain-containing protein [Alistipes sp.]
MNEIKKCSISGVAFTFEKVAYNRLNEYIDSLKRAYKNSSESDEIIADIEARIAELILSAQSDQQQVVCLPLVENIIAQLGSAEDISGNDEIVEPTTSTRITRRLYRDMDNSKLGGVCAGIGKYFNIDPVWARLAIFAPLLLVPIGGISYRIDWLSNLGGNLFGVMLVVYLILWFVIPVARTARQKLEMEGEPVTAKAIADRSDSATDEQRAKSNLASFVAGVGRVGLVLLKAFVVLLLFPLFAICTALIFTIIAGVSGLGAELLQFGNLGSLADIASSFGSTLPTLTIIAIIIPIVTIIYLFVVLVIGRKPKWWILLTAFIVWIALLIGIFSSAIDFVTSGNIDEVERIMKQDWDDRALEEELDSLEYNRLLNDPNADEI